jgi:hypothetical protein
MWHKFVFLGFCGRKKIFVLLVTSRYWILLESFIVAQLVKKYLALHRTQWFITVSIRISH